MSDPKEIEKAFGSECRCGFLRCIILRGPFKWRWCERCDGLPMPKAVIDETPK